MSAGEKPALRLKRVYEPPDPADGRRVLIDRIWPRGLTKEKAALDGWLREIAPSTALRKWFGHDPSRWEELKRRYFRELDANPEPVEELLDLAAEGTVTLLFAARDGDHNNAAALKLYLEKASPERRR